MRKDAALSTLRIARILDAGGYVFGDANLQNFFIDRNGRPMFHNLEAIRPKHGRKFPYADFHAACLAPLRLIGARPETAALIQRAGNIDIAEDLAIRRPVLMRFVHGIGRFGAAGKRLAALFRRFCILSPYAGLLHAGLPGAFVWKLFGEWRHRRRTGDDAEADWTGVLLERLEAKIRRIDVAGVTQQWTGYYAGYDLPSILRAGEDWRRHYDNERSRALLTALGDGHGRTVLDIGANQGYYSMLAAHAKFSVTAGDNDIGAIDGLYRMLRDAEFPLPVEPVLLDFVSLDRENMWRFAADAVLALGFTHHMRLVELLPWSVIAEKLALLSREVLVTEFKEGTRARRQNGDITEALIADYTLDKFVAALKIHFRAVEVVGSHTAPDGSRSPRELIVCRK
jgi:hypothetical protein